MTQSPGPWQWDCSQARIALGVYVLGAIDPAERALVDAHLATCEACQAELADLADLPALLAMVPAEEALTLADGLLDDLLFTEAPAAPALPDLAGIPAAPPMRAELADSGPAADPSGQHQPGTPEPGGGDAERLTPVLDLTAARRRRRRLASVGAVAAAAVVIGAASFGGVRLAAGSVSAHPNGHAQGGWETATGRAGQAVATIDYRPMGWGIQMEAKVFHIPAGTPCQMWVVKSDGTRVSAGSWITDKAEGQVWYPASAAAPAADVKAFVISVSGGQQITVTPT
jgi:hypothetical protein